MNEKVIFCFFTHVIHTQDTQRWTERKRTQIKNEYCNYGNYVKLAFFKNENCVQSPWRLNPNFYENVPKKVFFGGTEFMF